ncbi:flavodoxin [Sedimentibacter hydroxybenzoicus]|uniref:flavodoxin n=1 Tax=Sedimentibacter hydroxybenzoicus TaxID=29345 RepID=UPI00389A2A16
MPFCTHGGGGFGQIEKDIAKECPNSIIVPGIAVNGIADPEEVRKWLDYMLKLSFWCKN